MHSLQGQGQVCSGCCVGKGAGRIARPGRGGCKARLRGAGTAVLVGPGPPAPTCYPPPTPAPAPLAEGGPAPANRCMAAAPSGEKKEECTKMGTGARLPA